MSDIDEQHEQLKGRGGASVNIQDGRFTKLLTWFWGFVGLAVAAGSFTAASNLYQLNLTVARVADNNALAAEKLKDHEIRLRQVERDVSAIEGKVFRSGFDPLKDPVK